MRKGEVSSTLAFFNHYHDLLAREPFQPRVGLCPTTFGIIYKKKGSLFSCFLKNRTTYVQIVIYSCYRIEILSAEMGDPLCLEVIVVTPFEAISLMISFGLLVATMMSSSNRRR